MQITVGNQIISFHIQSSKKSTFQLEISPEGLITVKAPSKSTHEEIINFVRSQSKALIELQERLANRKYISSSKNYTETEKFLYLGKVCTLSDLLEIIPNNEEEIQLLLQKFYTTETKRIIQKRIKHFEKVIGVKAKSVTIVDSSRTWGTCNGLKELTFNYKLSMAPPHVIDYVIIHELCHILHLNHDRSFWRKVGAFDPNYQNHQNYLNKFGGVMTI